MNTKKRTILFCVTSGLMGLSFLTGLGLVSNDVLADDSVVSNASVTVPISCMMSGTVDVAHSATIHAGTYSGASTDYADGIGKTTLTAYCNDNDGFSIYAIGYTGDNYGTTTLVGQNSGLAINTKVYESGDTVSNWSMKVIKVDDSARSYNPANMSIANGFDSWHTVPDSYIQVAQYKATTGSSTTDQGVGALGAKVETTYASFVSQTQAADTYTGKVKYTMVHPYNEQAEIPPQPQPSTAGCIKYHSNVNDSVGTMSDQCYLSDGISVTLYPSNFSRDGYGFAGWSDAYDYKTNPNAHFYGPNQTITTPVGIAQNGLSLYAVWVKSAGSLQDSSKVATLCGTGTGSLVQSSNDGTDNLSSITALTDQRDNQVYAIAKLADGNCWMIENLRLESENSRGDTNKALAQGYGTSATYGNFIGLADAENTGFYMTYSPNSLYSNDGSNNTVNIGSNNDPAYRMPRYNNSNTKSRDSYTRNNGNIYSYGNYYTWNAAIADTSYYRAGDYNTTSLCPAGWHIPTGGFGSEYNTMFEQISAGFSEEEEEAIRFFPANFLYGGSIGSDTISYRGSNGNYWSSSLYGIDYAHDLYFNSGTIDSDFGNTATFAGLNVRCMVTGS